MSKQQPSFDYLRPEQVHENIQEWVQDFCVRIESRIVDEKPGIPEEEIEKLRALLKDYKKLLDLHRGKIKLSETRLKEMDEAGLSVERVPEKTCLITVKLLQGLVSLAEWMQRIDSLHRQKKPVAGKENIVLGAQANLRFLSFFLSVQKEFDLDLRQLTDLYTQIFYKVTLAYELKLIDLQNFPPGILAAVRGFWYLKQGEYAEANFYVPSSDEDMYHGVDLIAEKKDETGNVLDRSLFQIKGRSKGKEASVFDLSDPQQIKDLEKALQNSELPDWDLEHHQRVLRQLMEYRDAEQKKHDFKIHAYWVEVLLEY